MAAHRYWRVYITANNGSVDYTYLTELEFRDSPGGSDQAVGGTGIASSVFDSNDREEKPYDGSDTSVWMTAQGQVQPSWVGYDFGAGVNVSEIAVTAYIDSYNDRMPKDFDVQYSDDGSSWTTAWSVTGETGWGTTETRVFTDPNYGAATSITEHSTLTSGLVFHDSIEPEGPEVNTESLFRTASNPAASGGVFDDGWTPIVSNTDEYSLGGIPQGTHTHAFWIQADNWDTLNPNVWGYSGDTKDYLSIYFDGTELKGSGAVADSTTSTPIYGEWCLCVISTDTASGTMVSEFHHGGGMARSTHPIAPTEPGTAYYGQDSPADTYAIYGGVDQVGVWNRALTAQEITDLYNGGNGLPYGSGAPAASYTATSARNLTSFQRTAQATHLAPFLAESARILGPFQRTASGLFVQADPVVTFDLPTAGGLYQTDELVACQVTVEPNGRQVTAVQMKIDRGSGPQDWFVLTDGNGDLVYDGSLALNQTGGA